MKGYSMEKHQDTNLYRKYDHECVCRKGWVVKEKGEWTRKQSFQTGGINEPVNTVIDGVVMSHF